MARTYGRGKPSPVLSGAVNKEFEEIRRKGLEKRARGLPLKP
jgi:hypothetical protein